MPFLFIVFKWMVMPVLLCLWQSLLFPCRVKSSTFIPSTALTIQGMGTLLQQPQATNTLSTPSPAPGETSAPHVPSSGSLLQAALPCSQRPSSALNPPCPSCPWGGAGRLLCGFTHALPSTLRPLSLCRLNMAVCFQNKLCRLLWASFPASPAPRLA